MVLVELSKEDNTKLKKVKCELLTDQNATFRSYGKCNEILFEYAEKYGVCSNDIFHSIKD